MKSNEPKSETAPQAVDTTTEVPRRPYHKPQLRRLGSVRDLTLGSKGSAGDFGGTFKNQTKKM